MPQRIRIVSDGLPGGITKVTDAETGADLSTRSFGYDLSHRAGGGGPKVTLFCWAGECDVTAAGDVVEVPRSLPARARELAARIGNPAVTAAFAELLGVRMDATAEIEK